MKLDSQKRIASEILKCGVTRVRITPSKEVEEALTREDIRVLIRKGMIKAVQKKGTSRTKARKLLAQKKKGRRRGTGKRKGKAGATTPSKRLWIKQIRAQRRLLRDLRDSGRLEVRQYRKLILMAKGGAFRSKKHLLFHIKEKDILKPVEIKKAKKPKKGAKKPAKKPATKKPTAKKVKK